MKKILIFGVAGHVGSAVFKRLESDGHDISGSGMCDVRRRETLPDGLGLDAVVYCVGHCPPGGFMDAIKYPLSQYPGREFAREVGMHITGPFNVFHEYVGPIADGGHFVFMSTAATRILQMPRESRPPIHIYHHLAVIAAEDALIEGMRMDPEVIERNIKIHRVAPPRIYDSPFHNTDAAVPASSKAPVGVSTAEVVDAIVSCLSAAEHKDIVMLPQAK